MVFERPDDSATDEIVVAMADGASFRLPVEEVEHMLKNQTGQTIRQLTKQQETFAP